MEHAVSENVYAGTAMTRRASYMYGDVVGPGPRGQVSTGLGIRTSEGAVGLIPPTVDITHTGQEETVDGVRIVFQITPGTEAPAEMNFLFPDHRALCMAENATHNLHNLLTLRGALVRDPRIWSRYLDEAIELFSGDYRRRLRLAPLADLGHREHREVPHRAARPVRLPARPDAADAQLRRHRHRDRRGLRAAARPRRRLARPRLLRVGQPQREGHLPALSRLVRRTSELAVGASTGRGGPSLRRSVRRRRPARSRRARTSPHGAISDSPPSCSSTPCSPIPTIRRAKEALADVFEQLGFGSENATWRYFYLSGAYELRNGPSAPALDPGAGMAAALTVEQLFDTLAIRVDGPRAASDSFVIHWNFTDSGEAVRLTLSNGALIQTHNPRTTRRPGPRAQPHQAAAARADGRPRTRRHRPRRRRRRPRTAPRAARHTRSRLPDRHALTEPEAVPLTYCQ